MDENLIWISVFFRIVTIFSRVRPQRLRCFVVLLLLPATATALALPRFFGRGVGVVGVGNDAAVLVGKSFRGHRWRVLRNRESRLTSSVAGITKNRREEMWETRERSGKWINNNLPPKQSSNLGTCNGVRSLGLFSFDIGLAKWKGASPGTSKHSLRTSKLSFNF